jgi:HSP20 family protein
MPGMKPDDIRVRQEGEYLLIEGEVREETETGGDQKPLIRERRFGRYSRRVRLPQPINVEQAEAQYDRGVLTLTLPKAPTAAPKQIPVRVASAS